MNARAKKSGNKSYGPFSGTASKTLAFDFTEAIFAFVPAALYEHVKLRVEQNLRCLETHGHIQPKELVGADCWNEFDDEEKRMAEICIGYLCGAATCIRLWTDAPPGLRLSLKRQDRLRLKNGRLCIDVMCSRPPTPQPNRNRIYA